MAAGPPHLPPRAMMTSDELDWLVYSYLEESGYHHTSFSLLHESRLAGPPSSSSSSSKGTASTSEPANATQPETDDRDAEPPVRNPIMDQVVPPGHLIRLLQKALLYLEAEARYRRDPAEPVPRIVGYPIPPTLPLPPLPKYVPPPTPPPAPAPAQAPVSAPTSVPASKESTPPVLPAPAAESKSKGKGKAKAAAVAADDSTAEPLPKKAKKKALKEDKASSSEPAPVRKAKTPAPEPAKPAAANENGSSSSAAGAPKMPPVVASSGKGKERAVEPGADTSGDVSMHDVEPPASSKPNGRRASLSSADPPKREKAKDKVADAQAPSTSGGKREREKDDLRPPPAKKTAAAGVAATAAAADASSAGSQPKRSASPSVPRKTKPTGSSETTTRPAPTVSIASTSTSTTAPVAPTPNKFRITTTTKTVSTPVSVMHSPSLASAANGPPISAAQLAADKRRRGSGDNASPTAASKESSANAGDRLLKVKTEAGQSGASGASGSEAGSAHGAGGSNGSVGGAMGKNGLGTVPKSPTKPPSPLKDFDMRGVKEIKDDDAAVVRLKGHTVAKVQPCAFNPKVPSLLATGGGDSTCRIWDVPPFSASAASSKATTQTTVTDHIVCKHQSAQRRCDITCVAWDPSGSLLATGSEDGIVRIWTPSGDLHLVLSMHQRQVCSLKWNPMGTMLLTSSLDQTVCLWELSSGKVRQQYATHGDTVLDVDWNDDQTWASASMDKTVHLMSLSRTTPLHRFRGHRDEVNVVKFSPCGTLVASCSDDSTVRVWSLRNIAAVDRGISAKAVKKGDDSRRIDVDEEDGGPGGVFVLEGHESDVHQIAWHPEAGKPSSKGPRLLASCSFDSTAKLWDADAGTCLYTFARASDFVYSIAFEPGLGRYVATGSNDGRLDVYRVEDRTLLTEYTHTGPIYEITWHPHGQQIAVCGQSLIVGVVGFEPAAKAA